MNKEKLIQQLAEYNTQINIIRDTLNDLKYYKNNEIRIIFTKSENSYYKETQYKQQKINVNDDELNHMLKEQLNFNISMYNSTLDKLKSGSF